MIFSYLKRRRRNKILAEPCPSAWLDYLRDNVVHYRTLSPDEQARLRDDLRIFVAEKNWEGCGGLMMTDEIKVTIAALACLLVLAIDHDYFSSVDSILVYPRGYVVPEPTYIEDTTIMGEGARLGEAWYRGPVVLSWADVQSNAREPQSGENLVWHEFAHQLDMLDRAIDGTPPLGSREQYDKWIEVMNDEFDQLKADARAHRDTLLDTYGVASEAEFFAVATESFFGTPVELRARHPRLYELLREYYHQDPAERMKKG